MASEASGDISTVKAINPAAIRTSTVTGLTVDLAGYRAATFVLFNGVVTDGTHTPDPEESDDDSSWSNISASDLTTSFAALTSSSTAGTVQEVGYLGSKRYIRLNVTVTGSPGTGGYYDAVVVRQKPLTKPA